MLKNAQFKVVYASGEDEPVEFFIDALLESIQFDLGLGFFSTSGFRSLSLGFAYFISRGGNMRIIINNILSAADKQAILNGYNLSEEEIIAERIIDDLNKFYEALTKTDEHFFKCISWLIATKRIEFRAIVPKDNTIGIAHQKFGIFYDEAKYAIAFSGSANFSSNALFNNIETLCCYKSWTGEKSETERVAYFEKIFDKIWSDKYENIKSIPIEKVKTNIHAKFPVTSIDLLLEEETNLIHELTSLNKIPSALEYKLNH